MISFRKTVTPTLPGPVEERRTDRYTFTSRKALDRYFSAWVDEEDIEEVVEAARIGFVVRQGCDEELTRLQFLKKCEYALVRRIRNAAAD
jgi:hypothetical protein